MILSSEAYYICIGLAPCGLRFVGAFLFEYLQEKVRPALQEEADIQTEEEHERYLAENSMFNPNNQTEK